MSVPLSLFISGLLWCILSASLIFLANTLSSLASILTLSMLVLWCYSWRYSSTADECLPSVCSLMRVPTVLAVSPMVMWPHRHHSDQDVEMTSKRLKCKFRNQILRKYFITIRCVCFKCTVNEKTHYKQACEISGEWEKLSLLFLCPLFLKTIEHS